MSVIREIEKQQYNLLLELTKEDIIKLFEKWINQKPNLDKSNYESLKLLRQDYKEIAKQKRKALKELEIFKKLPLLKKVLAYSLSHSFSGRLQLKKVNGKIILEYTAGQYFPTEYRQSLFIVLSDYNFRVGKKIGNL